MPATVPEFLTKRRHTRAKPLPVEVAFLRDPAQFCTIRLRAWLVRCGRYLRRGSMILAYPVLWTDFTRLNKRAERVLNRVPTDTLGTELCDDLGCRHALGVLG